ncbi:family 1 glycosylhydrolase [Candidatus Roseilinea sp. NK_OTU-006]|uniref:family 1 glycosylhydrolase n=1 Tax=Candidatus Roseilinea sp. NK_OTU-006 TaxID=2704250 RepID=UPI00145C5250|nr:glycoside hydrolase family 1 protein [Candidatus Roseilinea sp. NK_OTU-006]
MSEFTLHFPPNFKWGTATAAHQVEGNNTNNQWWQWEQTHKRIMNGDRSGIACDWWNNAEADFDRMVALGLNAHRLSVEWSRIEPREGRFDSAALDRYRAMLLALRQRGIEPMVTLHHFTNPCWLEERRAWEDADVIVPLFRRFTEKVVHALGDLCDLWCTINEPNVYATMGYLSGGRMPPGLQDARLAAQVLRNMLIAHAVAYETLHEKQTLARVGLAHHMRYFQPLRPGHLLDGIIARALNSMFNQSILEALAKGRWQRILARGAPVSARKLRGTLDWIGLNYYTRHRVAFDPTKRETFYSELLLYPQDVAMTDFNFGEIYPEGILIFARQLSRYKLPIYITENGLPDHDDDLRPAFLVQHLHTTWQAIQMCYDVRGYYHWSFVDNFEWGEGWRMKFGLVAMDTHTQARQFRRSALLYRDIIQAGAITSAIVREYTPQLFQTLYR